MGYRTVHGPTADAWGRLWGGVFSGMLARSQHDTCHLRASVAEPLNEGGTCIGCAGVSPIGHAVCRKGSCAGHQLLSWFLPWRLLGLACCFCCCFHEQSGTAVAAQGAVASFHTQQHLSSLRCRSVGMAVLGAAAPACCVGDFLVPSLYSMGVLVFVGQWQLLGRAFFLHG